MIVNAANINSPVLVLNRTWMAIRVTSAKRAFSLLFRDLAEAIRVDDGSYCGYDFESWTQLGAAQRGFVAGVPIVAGGGSSAGDNAPSAGAIGGALGESSGGMTGRISEGLSGGHSGGGSDLRGYDWVRTVRMHIAVPKVIRLLGYDRLPQQDVKLNRRNIFARDRNRCQYCGRHFPTSELSLDHLVPRSQGGKSTWLNLVCCCVACNSRKGGRTPQQAAMTLVRQPVKPKRNPVINLRLGSEKYASWKAFLDNAYWSVELK
jgi:5-methylcytosine-specific restriction endonuclease McrA